MTNKNIQNPFRVIPGGLSEKHSDSYKEFVSAHITDTRLMGVVGMTIHWKLPKNTRFRDFYQFYYFDAEENGFDTYKSLLCSGEPHEIEELTKLESSIIGGLGAHKIQTSEREAVYMVQSYVELTLKSNLPLPGNRDEYEFLLAPRVELTEKESFILMCKQCPIIDSPYQVINYFLMRCFGKDFGAAKFLTKGYVRTNLFPEHKGATLLRNVIEEAPDEISGSNTRYHSTDDDKDFGTFDTLKSYMCESLIEYSGKYFLLVTQVTLDQLRVVKYEKISSFRVTTQEASLMTSRTEFVTVTDLIPSAPPFDISATKLTRKAMTTEYDNGTLFMVFQPNNDHVKKKTYILNDDVLGVYFLVDNSQLILAAYSLENIQAMEDDLAHSYMAPFVVPVSKYEFRDPVLYDFMNSIFEDFEDFVETISMPPKDEE